MTKSDLLAPISTAINNGALPLGVFNNPELFELEKELLFAKSWNFLAHESEIPKPGDYVQRYIADDAFIVSRDKENNIHVVLNACRHRRPQGMQCRKGQYTKFLLPLPRLGI
ncbi:MAG: hypothetical protein COB22_03180 [Cycloclasticus sp.]|nr:MAG: hypothetical protein COB22_03180 [Cycloclasticus sp.]